MPFSHYRRGRKGNDAGPADVFICTPCNSGRPCANYTASLADSAVYLAENNVSFDYWLHTEDCHVDDARNYLVHQFMQSGAKRMVFIDDDVGWDTISLAKLLCYQDADIVGGAYPLKQTSEEYPIRIIRDRPQLQARPDGLLEVEGIPTGFMRIDRHVIEKLSEHRKHLLFKGKEAGKDDPLQQVIFERTMVDGHRWSGDLNFCREARKLGFKVWVDPEMTFSHQGQKRWEGNFGRWLRNRFGVQSPFLDLAMEKLIAGNNSQEVFNEIHAAYGQEYSMGPAGLKAVYDLCKDATGPILEAGSGITTIIAAIACMRNGQTVHSLEHDLEWFRQVRGYIQTWKVRASALYYAPLIEYPDPDDEAKPMMWYGDGILDDLPKTFSVAIIDGPPRRYGREAAYKLIGDRIKDAKWLVDDVDDASQLNIVQAYADKYGKSVEVCSSAKGYKRKHAIVT
jgi:hypothetical protein